jgi:8-oxo-dGTP diphosphatase
MRTAYSAGGIVYRWHQRQLEVAMIATHHGKRWGLPKGHIRRGETAEAAALREIAEETGLTGSIDTHLTTIEYWFRIGSLRIHKYVDLFLVCYQHGTITPQPSEVDDAQWVDINVSISRASFQREREALHDAKLILLNQ